MSKQAGRKLKTAETTPPPALDPAKMTVRQYAVACVELHIDDWETANGRVAPESAQWKDAFWFFMRRMKSHPKLLNASPAEAAAVFHKLFMDEPTIQDYCLREDFGLDDVVTFVTTRWLKVRMLADMSPLQAAIEAAKTTKTDFLAFQCSMDDARSHVAALKKAGTIFSIADVKEYALRKTGREARVVSFHASELSVMPSFGVFLTALSRLHTMLARADGSTPLAGRPMLILGTDNLGTLLGVKGKTAWEYRQRLVDLGILGKLPKQGIADRFILEPMLLGTFACDQEAVNRQHAVRYSSIDLD